MNEIKEVPGVFYIGEYPEHVEAELEYELDGSVLIIHSTEVAEALRGQDVGEALVAHAVDYARRNGLKVRPLCSYARFQFIVNAEYFDVMDQ